MRNIHRKNPLSVRIKERYPLSKEESSKQTWHVSLDLDGHPLEYLPGDSIGVLPKNDPILVDHLIEAMGGNPEAVIREKKTGEELSLKTFLTSHANLSRVTSSFLKLLDQQEEISFLLAEENKPQLRAFLSRHDPLSVLREYGRDSAPLQELCDRFGPLLPRFYSIASCPKAKAGELDLTVALYTWEQNGDKRYGVASHFLCHLAEVGETNVPIFVQPADHFRLPEDHSTPIIMVGPGTGIAPFRAFMQDRDHHGATGKHFLFFGERNRATDFYYEEDWQGYENMVIHTAFSRDQESKVYVQHKLLAEGEKLYDLLEGGAHFYVCGDAKEMAKDVDRALHQIVQEHGSFSAEEARGYLKGLRKAGRYLLDVY